MNQKFTFREMDIGGVYLIEAFNVEDTRGCFTKDYSREIFAEHGLAYELAEVFYTTSHKGVIRGIHFQRDKQQPKLVRCIYGHVWDVVVDLRKNSPTFRQWRAVDLIAKNHNEVLIPVGCGHGYLVMEDSIVSYKCAEKFYGEYDDGIRWNDPDIAVMWPLEKIGGEEHTILSEKDRNLQHFSQFMKTYGGF